MLRWILTVTFSIITLAISVDANASDDCKWKCGVDRCIGPPGAYGPPPHNVWENRYDDVVKIVLGDTRKKRVSTFTYKPPEGWRICHAYPAIRSVRPNSTSKDRRDRLAIDKFSETEAKVTVNVPCNGGGKLSGILGLDKDLIETAGKIFDEETLSQTCVGGAKSCMTAWVSFVISPISEGCPALCGGKSCPNRNLWVSF